MQRPGQHFGGHQRQAQSIVSAGLSKAERCPGLDASGKFFLPERGQAQYQEGKSGSGVEVDFTPPGQVQGAG